jgi:hypothetical protein
MEIVLIGIFLLLFFIELDDEFVQMGSMDVIQSGKSAVSEKIFY